MHTPLCLKPYITSGHSSVQLCFSSQPDCAWFVVNTPQISQSLFLENAEQILPQFDYREIMFKVQLWHERMPLTYLQVLKKKKK